MASSAALIERRRALPAKPLQGDFAAHDRAPGHLRRPDPAGGRSRPARRLRPSFPPRPRTRSAPSPKRCLEWTATRDPSRYGIWLHRMAEGRLNFGRSQATPIFSLRHSRSAIACQMADKSRLNAATASQSNDTPAARLARFDRPLTGLDAVWGLCASAVANKKAHHDVRCSAHSRPISDIAQCRRCADIVAKVVLHWWSEIFRAADAIFV